MDYSPAHQLLIGFYNTSLPAEDPALKYAQFGGGGLLLQSRPGYNWFAGEHCPARSNKRLGERLDLVYIYLFFTRNIFNK